MARESLEVVKGRREAALAALAGRMAYAQFLGITFDRRGDELTGVLNFDPKLIGNPLLPALHGGVTAAFMEITAVMTLTWLRSWDDLEAGRLDLKAIEDGTFRLPKTIDFTTDYLRSGQPRDAYARARVNRSGRRYASVHVEAWQDNRSRLYAHATGHFLMPPAPAPRDG